MNPVMPLLALRVFTEIGRSGSVRQAAHALGVSAGAVSQQLRLLEDRVGIPLFQRTRSGMELSEAGKLVYPELVQAFGQLTAVMEKLEGIKNRRTLTINSEPGFAASWLVPRLGKFNTRFPDIDIRVEASLRLADLQRDGVDIAIRHGLGKYPGLHSDYLLSPVMIPVASPTLLRTGTAINTAEDCLAYPLLQDSTRSDWRLWFEALGITPPPACEKGMVFDDDFLLLRAAEAGQGIALVHDIHAQSALESGRLQQVLQTPWSNRFAYYAVTRPTSAPRAEIQYFLDWIRDEIQQNEASIMETVDN